MSMFQPGTWWNVAVPIRGDCWVVVEEEEEVFVGAGPR